MGTTISEIKNLTQGSSIGSNDDYKNFDHNTEFSSSITFTLKNNTLGSNCKETDNIQVTWKDEAKKLIARGVGGTLKRDGDTVTISGLVDVSKYGVGLNGQIGIGPDNNPEAVLVSVRIGNLNPPKNDWIIDFSDKKDGAPGTKIKLQELVAWINGKTADSNAVIYPTITKDNSTVKANEFEIIFKEFHFNITQNTFDFNVASADDAEIKFLNFNIKKVGFRVTNEPVADTKALPANTGG